MGTSKLEELRRAAEADPENMDKWLALGQYAVDRFIVGASEAALARVAAHRPDEPVVLGLLGKALNRRRSLTQALKVYEKAISISPDDPELLTGLGVVHGNAGRQEEALRFYERALKTDPGSSWAAHAYISSLDMSGRRGEQDAVLDRALRANPRSSLLLSIRAERLIRAGRKEEAAKALEAAFELLPKAGPDEQSRTLRNIQSINPKLAVDRGIALLSQDAENLDLYVTVALSKSRLGNEREGLALLDAALQLDPNNTRLLGTKAAIFVDMGDLAGAVKIKELIERAAPEDAITSVIGMVTASKSVDTIVSKKGREEYLKSCRVVLDRMPGNLGANLIYLGALIMNDMAHDAATIVQFIQDSIPVDRFLDALRTGMSFGEYGFETQSDEMFTRAAGLAKRPLERMLVGIARHSAKEEYSRLEEELMEGISSGIRDPIIYAILGRVQSYTNSPDAEANLEMAASMGVLDSKILLANMRARRGKSDESKRLLEEVVNTSGGDIACRIRALIGLSREEEAVELLEQRLKSNPSDLLSWFYLASIRKKQGKDAVKEIVQGMLQAGVRPYSHTSESRESRSFVLGELADELTGAIMSGGATEILKKAYLRSLIATVWGQTQES